MRVFFLTNNIVSENLIRWLINEAKEEVVVIKNLISKEMVEQHKPDFLISYNYKHIIREDILNLLPNRVINLHTSLLPWNRGAHPNLWSFLEDSPKGMTIHLIDKGIDTGDILVQREIWFDEEKESLSSTYEILQKELQELFVLNWGKIKEFQIVAKAQLAGGSVHFKKDFERIKHIFEDEGWDISIMELKRRFKQHESGNAN